jgi:hypothetical protein
MYRFWSSIIEPLCTAANVGSIVEVGIGQGYMTRLLLSYAKRTHGRVHAVDPSPTCDMAALCTEGGSAFTYYAEKSLDVLPRISADLVLIDGDHNWYTVLHELRTLSQWIPKPIIILHDTGWPYGRRDLYYDKECIPATYRHLSAKGGLQPSQAGFKSTSGLNAHLENALAEGGTQNGVKTAVEDFLAEEGGHWHWQELPGMHGLGILVLQSRIHTHPVLRAFLDSVCPSRPLAAYMEAVESDRLRELVQHETLTHVCNEQAHTLRATQQENDELRRQNADWKQSSSILQNEQLQLNKLIDVLEHNQTHLQETLRRIHATRTIRWTAWLRKIAGKLQAKK